MLRCLALLSLMVGTVSWSADAIDPVSKRRVDAALSIKPSDELFSWAIRGISDVDRESIVYATKPGQTRSHPPT
jgi:hypothetical protein